ncbi:MAG: hypothetical protein N3F03_07305 [Ignavibacteria bacterium]|nr:hypothetical protein [Ignavibacteria bacterium]
MKILLTNFKLIFSISTFLLLIVILFALAGIYFYYRRTLPELTKRDKLILFSLRLIAALVLIFSIFELSVEAISKRIENPSTVILIDNSKSVSEEKALIKEKLEKILQELKSSNQKIEIFTFDEKVREISEDSINQVDFSGHATNISSAINEIIKNANEKNYQNVILITDGIYNSGENPIYLTEKSNSPFFIFGVGDPKPKNDISIEEVITNDLIYAENQTPIRVNIKSNGFENQNTSISFFEDNKLIEKKNLQLQSNYQEIEFLYTPKNEGEKKLTFTINPIKGEYTEKNNSFTKYVKVLSNKIRVLTIAGKPSYDLSFINQAIKSNKDFRLETLIEKNTGEFYPLFRNESFIDSADVIFFVGFPTAINSERFLKRILSKIEKDNTPIFILVNPETDFNKLNFFKAYLPFDWRSAFGTASQIFIDVPEEKSKNEILNIDETNSVEVWNSFPPIHRVDREFISKPESEILSYYKIGNTRITQPLIVSRNLNRHRSLAFIGFNLWRLKLLNAMREEQSIYFERFINNSIKWLTSKEIEKNLIVRTSKKIFDVNEEVSFIGQLYDDANQPISDGQIYLDIYQGNNKVSSTLLKPLGNGIYSAQLENLEKGDFNFNATVEYAGKKYSSNGRFSVTESELEFRDLTLREDLLKRMATITKGSYIYIKNSDDFISNLNKYLVKKTKEKEVSRIYNINHSTLTLILIILFLSIEWFLRKRWGLL